MHAVVRLDMTIMGMHEEASCLLFLNHLAEANFDAVYIST